MGAEGVSGYNGPQDEFVCTIHHEASTSLTCSQFQQRVWRVHFCSCRSVVSFLSKLLQLSFCLSSQPELPPFSSCVKGKDCRHCPTLAVLLEIGAVVWIQAKIIDVSGRFPLKGVTSVFSSAVCYTGTLCPVRSSTYCSATVILIVTQRAPRWY